jgi:uncharacterized protein (TIGR00297 family)
MHNLDFLVLLFLVAGAAASARWKKLTPAAAVTGAICGCAIYMGDGFRGLALLALFFILGTAATGWGTSPHQSTRHAGQVIANGGIAAIAGLLALFFPAARQLFTLLLAASLSSATADTLSSELGMVYGRRFFNILTLKADERGLDGVISLEGLLLGAIGSALVAAVFVIIPAPPASSFFVVPGPHHQQPTLLPSNDHALLSNDHAFLSTGHAVLSNSHAFLILLIAGTVGNLADSLLGALFERRGLLSNDQVNILNTLIAAACAGVLACIHL